MINERDILDPLNDEDIPKVFVVGSNIAAGGTNMAYHLGCIVSKVWKYEPVNVIVDDHNNEHSVWDYPVKFSQTKLSELNKVAGKNDLLIANPSFSKFFFGASFPGKKLMYVQGCNTFTVLDGFFDKYIAVSPFVQRYMMEVYNLKMPVIPPFIHFEDMPKKLALWEDRSEGSVVTILKWGGGALLEYFQKLVNKKYPHIKYSLKIIKSGTPHKQVLNEMSKNRHFLWLSQVEGFGIPPLEAMMCGCTVVGFHAGGGLSYFQNNYNASVFSYPNIEKVVDSFGNLLTNPLYSEKLAINALNTATPYTYDRFLTSWVTELSSLIGPPPKKL